MPPVDNLTPTSDPKLKRLENLLKTIDDTVTKEEFINAVELIAAAVKDIKDTNTREFSLIYKYIQQTLEKLHGDTSTTLTDLKKQTDGLFVSDKLKGMEGTLRTMIDEELTKMHDKMTAHMSTVKSGYTPRKNVDYFDGKPGMTIMPTDEQLTALMIPLLPKVQDIIDKIPKVQTPAKSYQIHTKDVSAQCSGSNKTFSVGGSHMGIMGVYGTDFPVHFRPIIDYVETRTGILLTSAVPVPSLGATLIIQYIK